MSRLLKALLKLVVAPGALAVVSAASMAIQSFASYAVFNPISTPAGAAAYAPHTTIYGIYVDRSTNLATIAMTPFTSEKLASAFGLQYGMQLIELEPSFGRYIFTLPQIKIGPGPQQHEATVYFPPYASKTDIQSFITGNGLSVVNWTTTDDAQGRVAVVALPQVKPVLIDATRGIWRASVMPNIAPATISLWAKNNGIHLLSYAPATGVILIQGPKPRPVYSIIRRPVTVTRAPLPTKLYMTFQPGTSFATAQHTIQVAGGQLSTFNGTTEQASATVPYAKKGSAISALNASGVITCLSSSSTGCPAANNPSGTQGTGTDTGSTTPTTGTGTGWTTTDVTPPATTPTTPQLTAKPLDGHVTLTWTAVVNATSYQVWRVTCTATPTLVATTNVANFTDVGGAVATPYTYSIVPVLAGGPDSSQAATADATWVAASSKPVI